MSELKGHDIIVNGLHIQVQADTVTYEDVVRLAGMKGQPSVTWKLVVRGSIMHPGSGPVSIANGMIFNVYHTGNA